MERWTLENSVIEVLAHAPEICFRQPACCLHNRSDHHMREWRQNWRDDRRMMERTCPHGYGHPDPDQVTYWRTHICDWQWLVRHACDGCCHG